MEISFTLGINADLPNSLSLNNLVIVILLSRLCDIETIIYKMVKQDLNIAVQLLLS